MPANPPNHRRGRLEQEQDCTTWLHAEVSNIVLVGFPYALQQSENKPLREETIKEHVDVTYSVKSDKGRRTLAVGEMKRNLIEADEWETGQLISEGQKTLARELQG